MYSQNILPKVLPNVLVRQNEDPKTVFSEYSLPKRTNMSKSGSTVIKIVFPNVLIQNFPGARGAREAEVRKISRTV